MGKHRSRSKSSSSSRDGSPSSKWDGESGYRIHVSDLAVGTSRREIEKAFGKYGTVNEVWVASNPPCFAFVNFKHRSDAEKAIRDVDGKVIGSTRIGVSWARTRTFGGRHRGGRGFASSSYRSSGSSSRRRSRSRSRSNSRQRRRRHSRSNSRDRHRRESASPRNRKPSRSISRSPSRENGRSRSPSVNHKTKTRSPIAAGGD